MQKTPHYDCIELTSAQEAALRRFLTECGVINEHYQPPIFPGCIAVDGAILERAARLAEIFHRAAKAAYARAERNRAYREKLLRPFVGFPALCRSIEVLPFFLEFFRLDCYLHPETLALKIIEVNTSPGALPEHAYMDRFFGAFLDCSPPPPFVKASPLMVVQSFERFLASVGRSDVRTVGLIARDDGSYAPYADAMLTAGEMRRGTTLIPVLCAIEGGTRLSLFPGETQPIADIRQLHALYHHPGGTLQERETFTRWLEEHEIVLLPPRSNLLFTNKSFLGCLREDLSEFTELSGDDRQSLFAALLPSLPLGELEDRLDEVRQWRGLVLKRDLGSSGRQVHVLPFGTEGFDAVLRKVRDLRAAGRLDGGTWSVQEYVPHPTVECRGCTYGFEVMIYTVVTPTPSVLFRTRPFTKDKANIAEGGRYGHICRLLNS